MFYVRQPPWQGVRHCAAQILYHIHKPADGFGFR
jgi:hypothetical protein